MRKNNSCNKNIWICLFVFNLMIRISSESTAEDYTSLSAVQHLQEYIRINTVTHGDLSPAVEFWKRLAAEQDVPVNVYEYEAGYPVVVLKWAGADSSLNSIMLNSHMDVVPADINEGWTYPPFEGHITEDGYIYGRGTQDTKALAIQHYEALSRIKANNITLLRDVYMTLMPDEEVGSPNGMIAFVNSDEFAAMNVGIAIDEGGTSPTSTMGVFYYEKVIWHVRIDCYGVAAHGSTLPAEDQLAVGKCLKLTQAIMEFREEQYEIAKKATFFDSSEYTSINLNILSGGTANNVIPNVVSFTFDIRLSTRTKPETFEAQLEDWIAMAGENITLTYFKKIQPAPATSLNTTNPYWAAFITAAEDMNITITPAVPSSAFDARNVRLAGIPALGFSPMPNTERLGHAVDERLNLDIFLDGINIFEQLIPALADIPADATSANPSDYLVDAVV